MAVQGKVPTFELNDGNKMPVIGLGTANTRDLEPGKYRKMIEDAVDAGYRLIDTAWVYGNHVEVGEGLKSVFQKSHVTRKDLFITTKVWNTFHKKESVLKNCQTCLNDLQLNQVDLLLMHFPMAWKEGEDAMALDENGKTVYSDVDYLETWLGLEECQRSGWARSIGVSNFNVTQLKRLLANCKVKPVVNQVETHPYLTQQKLVDYCKENGIIVTAFSPIGSPYDRSRFGILPDPNLVTLLNNPVIEKISKAHEKTAAQICLKWGVQRGTVVIPKTVTKSRMVENLDIFSFTLSESEMQEITGLNWNWRAFPMNIYKDHPHFSFGE